MTSIGRGGPLDNHKYQFELSCVETREVIRSVLFITHNKKIMKEKVDSIYKHRLACVSRACTFVSLFKNQEATKITVYCWVVFQPSAHPTLTFSQVPKQFTSIGQIATVSSSYHQRA